jgi:Tfp pilus assembly protein PilN
MARLIFIIISLILSGVIVFSAGSVVLNGSSDPTMQGIFLGDKPQGLKKLLAEKQMLNEALTNAAKLKDKIASLEQAEKNISTEDLAKLDKFIPDHIDNINLIIDINNIAETQGMTIKNVKVRSGSDTGGANNDLEGLSTNVSAASQNIIADTYLSFSVAGDYESLLNFLDNLANSLRVADVTSLSFSVDDKGVNQYNFEIKTHWVK